MTIAKTDKQAELLVKLRQGLKLEGFAREVENQLENMAVYAKLGFEERLDSCVEAQELLNKERRCATLIKNAKFKDNLRLTDLTQTAEYGLSDVTLASLSSLQWVTKCHNIVIAGSCGVGKTGLSCALGYNCCMQGISVRYFRTADLLLELSVKTGMEKIRYFRKLEKYQVLILDDFGLSPINQEQAQYLFNVLDDRNKTASTIISTQLRPEGLSVFLGNDTKAEAITDRILHPAIVIELEGPSRRK